VGKIPVISAGEEKDATQRKKKRKAILISAGKKGRSNGVEKWRGGGSHSPGNRRALGGEFSPAAKRGEKKDKGPPEDGCSLTRGA